MKIAVPLAEGRLTEHFGHCREVALVEVDPERRRILWTILAVPPPHAPGVLPRWLRQQGARVVIAGGIGWRAQEVLREQGIEVIVGASSAPPRLLVEQYLSGSLAADANACDHGGTPS